MKNTTKGTTAVVNASTTKETVKAPATTLSPKSKAAVVSAKKNAAAEVQVLEGAINLVKPAPAEPEIGNPQGITLVGATGERNDW